MGLVGAALLASCGGAGWRSEPTNPGGVDAQVYLERQREADAPATSAATQPASQPTSQPASQPATQPTRQPH